MKYLAIIPARGGSKGLPNKNIAKIADKPLITWSIEQALSCSLIDDVVVSSDCPTINAIAEQAGAYVPVVRPEELARDDTPTEPVMLHVVDEMEKRGHVYDAVILLQPTCPLRKAGTLHKAIKEFEVGKYDSLVSVNRTNGFIWRQHISGEEAPVSDYDFLNRPRRQDKVENVCCENGSIYITKTKILKDLKNRLGGKICMFVMAPIESFDIDTQTDLNMVSAMVDLLNQEDC